MKALLFLSLIFIAFSCSEEEEPKKQKFENLIEIKDGVYTEYYPGKKAIKLQGGINNENQRHGRWVFYSENKVELSITHYNNGLKEGHSIVKYPNGTLYYYGEYRDDQKVGIWKTYDEKSKLQNETDFGGLE
jgi:antitoxin component YwqK of YwqJK toxin-antitoxin module